MRHFNFLLAAAASVFMAVPAFSQVTTAEKRSFREGHEFYTRAMDDYRDYRKTNSTKTYERFLANLDEAVRRNYPNALLARARFDIFEKNARATRLSGSFNALNELVKLPRTQLWTIADRAEAYYLLGICHERGLGTAIDIFAAVRCQFLAGVSCPDAKLALARLLRNVPTEIYPGMDVKQLLLYSFWLENPERDDDLMQQFILVGGRTDEYEKTLAFLADAGDPRAAFYLADHYFRGKFFPNWNAQGNRFLNMAADFDPDAMLLAGDRAAYGRFGWKKDEKEASRRYLAAFSRASSANAAAERLAKASESVKDFRKAYFYYVFLGDWKNARRVWKSADLPEFGPDDIYLKAKEYAVDSKAKNTYRESEYRNRITMAANAGSHEARQEWLRWHSPIRYDAIVKDLEEHPRTDNLWLYQTGMLCLLGAKAGLIPPEKAVSCFSMAAAENDLNSMFLLYTAYLSGSLVLGIRPDPARAAELETAILKLDPTGEKASIARKRIRAIAESAKLSDADRDYLIRTAMNRPEAARLLSKNCLERTGKEGRNPVAALIFLEFAQDKNAVPAELEQVFDANAAALRQQILPPPEDAPLR